VTTVRTVIPTTKPQRHLVSLDVSELSDKDADQLDRLYAEYTEYKDQSIRQLFNFENWVSHTNSETVVDKIKWRTFLLENTTFID
jgi:hypothetical protein